MKRQYVLYMLIFLVLCYFPFESFAQVADPGNPDAPLDGGLSILIAAAVGYGVRKRFINKEK